jgi:hypothetical protein
MARTVRKTSHESRGARAGRKRARKVTEAGELPRGGDRFRVIEGFAAHLLTTWRVPFTGGHEAFLPAGLEFIVEMDLPRSATAVSALPDPYDDWERKLVSSF